MNDEKIGNASTPDDLNIVEFEGRLFPKPIRTFGDMAAVLLAALDMIDEYGRDRVAELNDELMSLEAASMSAMVDVIRQAGGR